LMPFGGLFGLVDHCLLYGEIRVSIFLSASLCKGGV